MSFLKRIQRIFSRSRGTRTESQDLIVSSVVDSSSATSSMLSVKSADSQQKITYVESINNSLTLKDDVFCGKSPLSAKELIPNPRPDSTEFSKLIINNSSLSFLLDDDGMFEVGSCFIVNLEAGSSLVKKVMQFGHYNNYLAVICLKNTGISGYCIPNTNYVTKQSSVGDFTVSRALNGVRFFQQIGGESSYLLVTLVPSKKLHTRGFRVTRPLMHCRTTMAELYKMIEDDREKAIKLLENVIDNRIAIESAYFNMCQAEDMFRTFKVKGCVFGKKLIDKSLLELQESFESYVRTRSSSIGNSTNKLEQRNKINNNIACISNLFSTDEKDNKTILYAIQSYIDRILDELDNLFNELNELVTNLSKAANTDVSCLNAYVIKKVRESQIIKRRNELLSKYYVLDKIGFPEAEVLI
ncbi:rhoa signaling inhibitor [Pteropox virus]|uniref:Rhoa signaling inhibitor n=1 Tax=Pteropox virus TaxID=1873698 RepID=A0A1B1MRB8_9POXV|nr:rhoa signaling inhibitor [Pteropox virus]ANS71103.1 rhoa signaling inhibitor [Pteropox virus]